MVIAKQLMVVLAVGEVAVLLPDRYIKYRTAGGLFITMRQIELLAILKIIPKDSVLPIKKL